MGIKIGVANLNGARVAVSVPTDDNTGIEIGVINAINVDTLLEVRDVAELYRQSKIPVDIPLDAVKEALDILLKNRNEDVEAQAILLKGTKLERMLGVGANLAAIAGAFVQFLK